MFRRGDTRRSTALTRTQQPSIYDQRDYAAGSSTAFGMQEPYHPGTRTSTHSFLPGVEYLNEYGQPITTRRNKVTINPGKYADTDRDTADVARDKTAQYLGVTGIFIITHVNGTELTVRGATQVERSPRQSNPSSDGQGG